MKELAAKNVGVLRCQIQCISLEFENKINILNMAGWNPW